MLGVESIRIVKRGSTVRWAYICEFLVIFGREFQVPLLLTLERLFAQYTQAVNELVSFESKMAARTCEKIAQELRFCHVPYLTTIVHEKGQNMASSKCLYYEILNFSSIVRPRFSKQFSVMFLKHHKIDLGRCKLQNVNRTELFISCPNDFSSLHIRTINFVTQR